MKFDKNQKNLLAGRQVKIQSKKIVLGASMGRMFELSEFGTAIDI
jgi:hypothetical protein